MKIQIIKFLRENIKQKQNKKTLTNVENFINSFTQFIGFEKDNDDTLFSYIQFVKNNIQLLVNVYPNIILNSKDNDFQIPKYMNELSLTHKMKLIQYMEEYYTPFFIYYKNPVLQKILFEIQKEGKYIVELANSCPVIINQKYNVDYSSFNQPIVIALMEFLFLKVISGYMELSQSTSCIYIPKKKKKTKKSDFTTLDAIEEEYVEFSMEETVLEGNSKELQSNVANLLLTMLNISRIQKEEINISYDQIMDKIFKLKEGEKTIFTTELKAKTEEERNVDNELKRNKLGRWNKGLQKGLTEYDENVWEEEQNMRDILLGIEERARKENQEEFVEDILEQLLVDEREDRENMSMRMLSENFMNGDDWDGYEMEEEDWDDQN